MTIDTHGTEGKGWYGFDLDGTLAEYDGWKGLDNIGEPIPKMVEIIKALHDAGEEVKILTARVSRSDEDNEKARRYINEWCEKNLGFTPEVTHAKDSGLLWLFDDRAIRIEQNTGRVVGDLPDGVLPPFLVGLLSSKEED